MSRKALSPELQDQLEPLATLPDDQADTTEIPEGARFAKLSKPDQRFLICVTLSEASTPAKPSSPQVRCKEGNEYDAQRLLLPPGPRSASRGSVSIQAE